MRCLALAGALRERGAECAFFCQRQPGDLIDFIGERGFAAHALHLQADAGRDADARATLAALGAAAWDRLVVDHYGLDAAWERRLRSACGRLMALDDMPDRAHDCDLLLDQNFRRARAQYAGLVPTRCEMLLGADYALLRPEFAAAREWSLARRSAWRLERVLVTMGGTDEENATGAVLEGLRDCPLPAHCRITVVLGLHAPWKDAVERLAVCSPWPVEILCNVADMAALMAQSDVCIGAAGSTSWERCCLGLPTALVSLAANQDGIATALESHGAAVCLRLSELDAGLRRFFSALAAGGAAQLSSMSARAAEVADGLGAWRVADRLCA